MRLIDADALKTDFQDRLEKAKRWKEHAILDRDEEIEVRATATIDFIIEVIMTINNAPTAAPKKGEWRASGDFDEWYECPFCHFGATFFDGLPNFCGHCGADLREEGEL